jgi:AcrR family transcriptional regulator
MVATETQVQAAQRWRRRKEARPGEILGAALTCFAEHGFAATRLDDVAHRAGVTKGTLYLYFQNKEELFKAVVSQALVPNLERGEALIGEADSRAAEPQSAAALLTELIRGWAELAHSPAGAIPKIVISEAGNFPDLARFYREQVVDRRMALLRRVLRLGITRGEFRAVDIDDTARCVVAPVLLAMLWRHSLGRHEPADFDPDALSQTHLQLLLDGLRVRVPMAAERAADGRGSDKDTL